MKRKLNILVACEESQAVCRAFRKLGQNAYSCDLLPCSGTRFDGDPDPHPEWHFNHDITTVLDKSDLRLQNNLKANIKGDWDIMIGHPPCTFLSVSGAKWYYHPEDKNLPIEDRRPHPNFPTRAQDREDGAAFFMLLANANVKRIAIENPVGIMSSRWRKPDQTIQPYMFGDAFSKGTCLWLKNLKELHPSNETDDHGEWIVFGSGKKQPKWYSDALTKSKSSEERRTMRSKTFPGIARAIAEQWTIQVALEEGLLEKDELLILGEDYLNLSCFEPEQLELLEEKEQKLVKLLEEKKKLEDIKKEEAKEAKKKRKEEKKLKEQTEKNLQSNQLELF